MALHPIYSVASITQSRRDLNPHGNKMREGRKSVRMGEVRKLATGLGGRKMFLLFSGRAHVRAFVPNIIVTWSGRGRRRRHLPAGLTDHPTNRQCIFVSVPPSWRHSRLLWV